MNRDANVLVAGARGMVGSAIVRKLTASGYQRILAPPRTEVDFTNGSALSRYMASARPSAVIVAAAKVGGILANSTYPADFLRQNLAIELNMIDAAHKYGVNKLLFLGSTCIYPRLAPQPLREESLLSGPLEETNEWYAIAKIAGIKLCQAYRRQHGCNFISAMPTNLYGPNDNFDLQSSHVVPALIRKFHEARVKRQASVTIWGTGTPLREFLHVDDCADACLFLMDHYDGAAPINIGVGHDLPIAKLAEIIAEIVGFSGRIEFDPSKPDGTPRKLVDVSRLSALGWKAQITLAAGLAQTYAWFKSHVATLGV